MTKHHPFSVQLHIIFHSTIFNWAKINSIPFTCYMCIPHPHTTVRVQNPILHPNRKGKFKIPWIKMNNPKEISIENHLNIKLLDVYSLINIQPKKKWEKKMIAKYSNYTNFKMMISNTSHTEKEDDYQNQCKTIS